MSEDTPDNFFEVFLNWEYKKYSSLLINLQKHVSRCYDDCIISLTERNIHFKNLNEIIKTMQIEHDQYVIKYNDESYNKLKIKKNWTKLLKYNNEHERKINHAILVGLLEKDFEFPFQKTNSLLKETTNTIGFNSLNEVLSFYYGFNYENNFENDVVELLRGFNETFIPLRIKTFESDESEPFCIKKICCPHDALIDNYLSIKIIDIKGAEKLNIEGFFDYDTLNIYLRTSQICSNYIEVNKQEKKEAILAENFNEKFCKQYLKCTPLYDVVGMSVKDFINTATMDYKKYQKVIQYTFVNQVKDFMRTDIDNMHKIIKLLLIGGSEQNIRQAGMVFSLIKDKKVGSDTVANIIYRNLTHHHQNKLRKSTISIKEELEKIKSLSIDDIDLKKQITMCSNMPNGVKKAALEKIEEMKSSNNEYYKQLMYVRHLIGYPWISDEDSDIFNNLQSNMKESKIFLNNLMDKMDNIVYGHKNCKDTIQQIIAKWISNPQSSGSAIGLEGPPGVGKTLLAKGLGEALGIPYVQISLGGQNDGEILIGHGYTYSGAQPGMVVKKMIEAGSGRCIMYFDELDKACQKYNNNEIFNILIHMTDKNMNSEFQDRFFQEVSFPLNKVIFVFSYNDSSLIDPILLDRLTKLRVKPYSLPDKINIARDFLMKETHKTLGFENSSVKIKDDDIKYLINEYSNEAGVRELGRKIETLFMKMNLDRIMKQGFFKRKRNLDLTAKKPLTITRDMIHEYLDKPMREAEKIHEYDSIGVVNGLYATTTGNGGIVPIQILNNKTGTREKFNFILTGSQGKVMRESIHVACSIALEYVSEIARNNFFDKHNYGFHIHTPSGATPKDGPSAGAAFATAFVSRILGKKIRRDVGMTGEIDLMGRVTKIGGLVYKITGARKAGIKKVLVSEENKDDVDEIEKNHNELVSGDFEIKFVKTLADVIRNVIIDITDEDLIKGEFHFDPNTQPNASFENDDDEEKPKKKQKKSKK